MFGTLLKYVAVATAGAIVFATAGHFMDADVVDGAKEACTKYANGLTDLPTEEFKEKMKAFILVNRDDWVRQLTYATSIKDLDDALAAWA